MIYWEKTEKNELWTLYLNFDRQIFERNANGNAKNLRSQIWTERENIANAYKPEAYSKNLLKANFYHHFTVKTSIQ